MLTTPRTASVAVLLCALLAAAGCGSNDAPTSSPSSSGAPSSATTDSATDALVRSGLDQLTAGDDDAARTTFANVLSLDPHNLYALYNLGLIAQQSGHDTQAGTYYTQALAENADYVPALYNQAILTEGTDLDAAVASYRRIVELDPMMAAAFMRLGFALVHQGDTQDGESYLAQGIALDPSMKKVEAPSYSK